MNRFTLCMPFLALIAIFVPALYQTTLPQGVEPRAAAIYAKIWVKAQKQKAPMAKSQPPSAQLLEAAATEAAAETAQTSPR